MRLGAEMPDARARSQIDLTTGLCETPTRRGECLVI